MSSPGSADRASSPSLQEVPISTQEDHSSPPRSSTNRRKEQRNPSVTPRKFRRFFTPRSHHGFGTISSRRALHQITAPALNRQVTQSSPLRPFKSVNSNDESPTSFIRDSKRRKTMHTPEISPRKSPRRQLHSPGEVHGDGLDENIFSSPCERAAQDTAYVDEEPIQRPQYQLLTKPLKRITQRSERGLAGQLLNLSLASSTGRRRQHDVYPVGGMLII